MNRHINYSISLISSFLLAFAPAAFAFTSLQIGPTEAVIKSSIKYSVIGKYRAEFDQYSGEIKVDDKTNEIQSVILNIESASIKSNCSWCDKIVRSKQLLSVEEFPKIIFRSDEIIKENEGYWVKGALSLHGETKEISFPFKVQRGEDTGVLNIEGQWVIKRKEFNIVWNKLLDKGGILVGNNIIVDWEINSPIVN
jgi:polyisoprenoid-binding protein YceI